MTDTIKYLTVVNGREWGALYSGRYLYSEARLGSDLLEDFPDTPLVFTVRWVTPEYNEWLSENGNFPLLLDDVDLLP